jgi:hypothetical protein
MPWYPVAAGGADKATGQSAATTGNLVIGPARTFGTDAPSRAQVAADVPGLTTAINYTPATDPNVTSGIPNAYPGHGTNPFPAGVIGVMDFEPDIPNTLNGSLDTVWTALLTSCPAGTCLEPYHEANVDQVKWNYTAADIVALDTHVMALRDKVAPWVLYGRGLATHPVEFNGQDPTPFLAAKPDYVGMDGYQHDSTSQTPDDVFGGTLAAARKALPGTPVRIIETNSAFDCVAWINAVWPWVVANDVAGLQTFWSSSCPWQSSYVPAFQAVSDAIAAYQ